MGTSCGTWRLSCSWLYLNGQSNWAHYKEEMKSRILTICCAAALLYCQTPRVSAIEDGSTEAVAADVLVVRPACFVMTILGSALFVVALPVAAISHSTKETAQALVVRPARATFTRPVGDMSDLLSE